jgi:hypothetical protein
VWRAAGVAALALALPLGARVHVGASTELLTQSKRPRFVIENIDAALYSADRFALRALLVGELQL